MRQERGQTRDAFLLGDLDHAAQLLNRQVQLKEADFDWTSFRKLDLADDLLNESSVVEEFLDQVVRAEGSTHLASFALTALARRSNYHYRERAFLCDPLTSRTHHWVCQ